MSLSLNQRGSQTSVKSGLYDPRVWYFLVCWILVCAVAAVDVYWSIRLSNSLREHELNPIGCWLIHIDGGSIALFMSLKFCGTTIALSIMPLLFFLYDFKIGYFVMVGVAAFMAALFCFLTWG